MANSARRALSYKPRLSDWEAYELLPPTLRKLLQDTVTEWSAYAVLRFFNKNGLKKTITWVRDADDHFMRKGWIPARGNRKAMPSSYVACRVKPLRSYEERA